MKVKNKIVRVCSLLSVLLFITTCDTLLELPNDSLLPEEQAYVDEFSARSSVMGVYALLQDVAQQLIILGELQGDLLTVTENADNDLRQLNEHTVMNSARCPSWSRGQPSDGARRRRHRHGPPPASRQGRRRAVARHRRRQLWRARNSKRKKSWNAPASFSRHPCADIRARSTPSTTMRPLLGAYMRASSLTRVVLPAPFFADDGDHRAGFELKGNIVEHTAVVPGVGERHVLEADAFCQPCGNGSIVCSVSLAA